MKSGNVVVPSMFHCEIITFVVDHYPLSVDVCNKVVV